MKIYYRSSFNTVAGVIVGMLGYKLNNDSLWWGIIDGLFYPIALIKWIVCQELTFTLIKDTFPFLFK